MYDTKPLKITYSSIEWMILEANASANGFGTFKGHLRKELHRVTGLKNLKEIETILRGKNIAESTGILRTPSVYPVPNEAMHVLNNISGILQCPISHCVKMFITDPIIANYILSA